MDRGKFRLCLVGPLPPPYGGMAVQTAQLVSLIEKEGHTVMVVPVNLPLPRWLRFIEKVRYIRAMPRLVLYLGMLMRSLRKVDLVHILSNSYLSFFLYTVPPIFVAKLYRCKVVINYRGGLARDFFKKYGPVAWPLLRRGDAIVVPSSFLKEVFEEIGFTPQVVPNIIDLERFSSERLHDRVNGSIRVLVVRNFEKIYNVACAVRAFYRIQKEYPDSTLTLVGEGSEEETIRELVVDMRLQGVRFAGRIENENLPTFYREATVVLNPSNADNMPISVLEAFASGVPIVSTNVGGIPYMITDRVTGLLVDKDDDKGMAESIVHLHIDGDFYRQLSENGRTEAMKYSWQYIRARLFAVYENILYER